MVLPNEAVAAPPPAATAPHGQGRDGCLVGVLTQPIKLEPCDPSLGAARWLTTLRLEVGGREMSVHLSDDLDDGAPSSVLGRSCLPGHHLLLVGLDVAHVGDGLQASGRIVDPWTLADEGEGVGAEQGAHARVYNLSRMRAALVTPGLYSPVALGVGLGYGMPGDALQDPAAAAAAAAAAPCPGAFMCQAEAVGWPSLPYDDPPTNS